MSALHVADPDAFYLLLSGEQEGPFTMEQIRFLMRTGQAGMGSLYWQEGLTEWLPLSTVRDLIAPARAAARVVVATPPRKRRLRAVTVIIGVLGLVACAWVAHDFWEGWRDAQGVAPRHVLANPKHHELAMRALDCEDQIVKHAASETNTDSVTANRAIERNLDRYTALLRAIAAASVKAEEQGVQEAQTREEFDLLRELYALGIEAKTEAMREASFGSEHAGRLEQIAEEYHENILSLGGFRHR